MPDETKCPKCGAEQRRSSIDDGYVKYECGTWFDSNGEIYDQSPFCVINILTAENTALREQVRELREALKEIYGCSAIGYAKYLAREALARTEQK